MTPEKLNEIFNASGLKAKAFAKEMFVDVSTFRNWRNKDSYSMWLANNIELRVKAWQNRSK